MGSGTGPPRRKPCRHRERDNQTESLISVDLPDPFCPISAWTSPARATRSTDESTRVPEKLFVRPRISRSAAPVAVMARLISSRLFLLQAPKLSVLRDEIAAKEGVLVVRHRFEVVGDEQTQRDAFLDAGKAEHAASDLVNRGPTGPHVRLAHVGDLDIALANPVEI